MKTNSKCCFKGPWGTAPTLDTLKICNYYNDTNEPDK